MLRLVGMLLILESFDPNILVLTRLKFLQAPREVQYHIKIQFGAFSQLAFSQSAEPTNLQGPSIYKAH